MMQQDLMWAYTLAACKERATMMRALSAMDTADYQAARVEYLLAKADCDRKAQQLLDAVPA